eukprot:COSAG04_NODE_312_length_17133_cov_31.976928_7_plen_85_part_00
MFLSPKQGKRPQQLPQSKLNLQSLERIVMKVTAPVMRAVEDEAGLGMHCLRKPWCAVLLRSAASLRSPPVPIRWIAVRPDHPVC